MFLCKETFLPIFFLCKETFLPISFPCKETFFLYLCSKHSSNTQIADLPDSYVVADDIEIGFGNKIPLWLFGLIY